MFENLKSKTNCNFASFNKRMQKIIAIFMMTFASLVLLAHAVVPHHHYNDNMACFVLPHESEHDHDGCNHNDADHQEKHDADHNNDCCLLNDVLAVIPDNYKPEDLKVDFSSTQIHAIQFLSMIKLPDFDQEFLISFKDFRQRPYLDYSYQVFSTHGFGLRAPPYC